MLAFYLCLWRNKIGIQQKSSNKIHGLSPINETCLQASSLSSSNLNIICINKHKHVHDPLYGLLFLLPSLKCVGNASLEN